MDDARSRHLMYQLVIVSNEPPEENRRRDCSSAAGRDTITKKNIRVRVSMFIRSKPEQILASFVEPGQLEKFWLLKADAPLRIGLAVKWKFLVEGAEDAVTATVMDVGKKLAWTWSDGSTVTIDF